MWLTWCYFLNKKFVTTQVSGSNVQRVNCIHERSNFQPGALNGEPSNLINDSIFNE